MEDGHTYNGRPLWAVSTDDLLRVQRDGLRVNPPDEDNDTNRSNAMARLHIELTARQLGLSTRRG